jgi:hypothetical protein
LTWFRPSGRSYIPSEENFPKFSLKSAMFGASDLLYGTGFIF